MRHSRQRCAMRSEIRSDAHGGFVRVGFLLVLLSSGWGPTLAQDPPSTTSVQLSPEVVLDTASGEAYVASTEGGLAAVELSQGRQLWHSNDVSKPLAVVGDQVIGEFRSETPDNKLRITTLDRRNNGRSVRKKSVVLPGAVNTSPANPAQSFRAKANVSGNSANVTWEYVDRPLRGAPTGRKETLPGDQERDRDSRSRSRAERTSAPPVLNGTFQLDLASGNVSNRRSASRSKNVISRLAPTSFDHLPGVAEPQYLSADGKHILSSVRVADDTVVEKYQWTIYDRDKKQRLGEFKSQTSFVPFVVAQSRVYFVAQPVVSRTATGLKESPLEMRAVDLNTGSEVWKKAVRNTTVEFPPPP